MVTAAQNQKVRVRATVPGPTRNAVEFDDESFDEPEWSVKTRYAPTPRPKIPSVNEA